MSLSRAPARDTSETPSPRERIRSHMKMVISQLEGILIELKDVAKELREVRLKVSLHIIRLPGVMSHAVYARGQGVVFQPEGEMRALLRPPGPEPNG